MNSDTENALPQATKKRIDYIDAMRGFTMILVVYCHICIYVLHYDSFINSVFIRFRMPLFFFISGFMVYSSKPITTWIVRRFKNRLLNQFLPTFVTGSLFALFSSYSFRFAIFDTSKLGYWFTIVLFEMFLVYLLIAAITDKFSKTVRLITYSSVIIVSSVLFMLLRHTGSLDSEILNLFSVNHFLFYVSYFFVGIICKMYTDAFLKIIQNRYFTVLILSFFVASVSLDLHNAALKFLTSLSGVFIIYRTFQFNKDYFSNQNKVSRGLSFIGKNTLPVYFLHYFIIQGIHIDNSLIMHAMSSSWLFELLFCFVLSLFVVVLCLIADRFLKGFSVVHTLMFGPNLKK